MTMAPSLRPPPGWKRLFSNAGFPFYFAGLFVSLFGTGMNFAGVTLYVLAKTGSTVQVSFTIILLTLPRLLVPPFGGVLADRVDRRYLAVALDLVRAAIVLSTAAWAWSGRLQLWQLYLMVLLLGAGFAVYWSSSMALLQELIPAPQLVDANSAVLVAVQGGMLVAGALVGFVYDRAGLAGILAIDGVTYALSAVCFYLLRRGYVSPRMAAAAPLPSPGVTPGKPPIAAPDLLTFERMERGLVPGMVADIEEGLKYLRAQPAVAALGTAYACMMAGVISANVLVVALAYNLLHAGPRGYGFIEAGWALGAIAGGLAAAPLTRRRPYFVLIGALVVLAVGNTLFPYAGLLVVAVAMNALFGGCRAVGAVVTQSSILSVVPRHLMGRTQSAFAAIATLLQVLMSLVLGWLADHTGLPIAFVLLGLLYGTGVVAAMRARALCAVPGNPAPVP
jgi:MFS family permease